MPLYFGLGEAEKIDSVEITWPSGKKQAISDLCQRDDNDYRAEVDCSRCNFQKRREARALQNLTEFSAPAITRQRLGVRALRAAFPPPRDRLANILHFTGLYPAPLYSGARGTNSLSKSGTGV